jgi:hypothetical protein
LRGRAAAFLARREGSFTNPVLQDFAAGGAATGGPISDSPQLKVPVGKRATGIGFYSRRNLLPGRNYKVIKKKSSNQTVTFKNPYIHIFKKSHASRHVY